MNKFHGILSLALISVAALVGLYSLIPKGPWLLLFYGAIIFTAPFVIVYSWCRKCICSEYKCAHVIPAMLSKIFRRAKSMKYSCFDYIGVIVPMGLVILFPQFALFQNKPLFALFWVLLIIGALEIRFFVCSNCDNKACIANKKF